MHATQLAGYLAGFVPFCLRDNNGRITAESLRQHVSYTLSQHRPTIVSAAITRAFRIAGLQPTQEVVRATRGPARGRSLRVWRKPSDAFSAQL